jgi:hypothetical protein
LVACSPRTPLRWVPTGEWECANTQAHDSHRAVYRIGRRRAGSTRTANNAATADAEPDNLRALTDQPPTARASRRSSRPTPSRACRPAKPVKPAERAERPDLYEQLREAEKRHDVLICQRANACFTVGRWLVRRAGLEKRAGPLGGLSGLLRFARDAARPGATLRPTATHERSCQTSRSGSRTSGWWPGCQGCWRPRMKRHPGHPSRCTAARLAGDSYRQTSRGSWLTNGARSTDTAERGHGVANFHQRAAVGRSIPGSLAWRVLRLESTRRRLVGNWDIGPRLSPLAGVKPD